MTKRLVVVALVMSAACWCGAQEESSVHDGSIRVGVAAAAVNPDEGTFLAGYDNNRASTGVHDDLYAKAVVFADDSESLALVVVDSIGIQYDTVQEIRTAAAALLKDSALAPGHILVQSTHSHCSPDVIGIYGKDLTETGRNPAYMKQLVDTAAAQVAKAASALQPARVFCAETSCKGWAVNDSEPDIVDHAVAILECRDESGKPLVTLTNFACHPTVLDGDTTEVSADWVGTFYRDMAAGMAGEHLFLQGCVGAWVQPVTPERTFALAEKYGADLAKKVLAALEDAKPIAEPKVRFARKAFDMPVKNPAFSMMSDLKLVPRNLTGAVATEVAWFAIGPAQFATHPGETAPEFGLKTKDLMDSGPKFVLGLGLDQLGYICPERYYDPETPIPHAKYLANMSPGVEAGPAMIAALAAIIP